MAVMTGGRAIVESLKAQGVDLIFGIVSVHNLDFYDALYDSQARPELGQRDGIRCI